MGFYYRNGNVVIQQDYTKAHPYLLVAAKNGDMDAQYMLGSGYLMGLGVQQDFSEAKKWLNKAIAQGHKEAEKMLKSGQALTEMIRDITQQAEKVGVNITDKLNVGYN